MTAAAAPLPCPLCAAGAPRLVAEHGRRFHLCGACALVFVDPADHPTPEQAAARYALHHNDPADPGYRAHLERLVAPLAARVPAPARALDYGAGPTAAGAALLRARGYSCAAYDPCFAPDEAALTGRYDLVACCEVVEHFRAPALDFARLASLLAPGGWLGLQTQILAAPEQLPGWWYARDPTHVGFYQERTLAWLAARYGWTLERPGANVALFRAR